MKIATWNVNSLTVRLPQVLNWLAAQPQDAPVDVLALQELKLTDDKFPAAAFQEVGYHAQWFGQKTYNGVALISRQSATDVVKNIPGFADDMARVITATIAGVRVIGAYFPNGQAPGSDKFAYKMRWLRALQDMVRAEMAATPAWCWWATATWRLKTATRTTLTACAKPSTTRPKSATTSRRCWRWG